MVNLATQNYIYTLFLCEFNAPINVANTVRIHLQQHHPKRDLYLRWVESRLAQTKIPKLKYDRQWYLFESDADCNLYTEWLWSYRSLADKPKIKYLNIADLMISVSFEIRFIGREYCYALALNHYNYNIMTDKFLVQHWRYGGDPSTATAITEQEFYEKVDRLLDVLNLTNEIPFDSYNVK